MTQDHQTRYKDLPVLDDVQKRTYRLGIMGGTFDPIHNGHLVAAEQAYDDLDLDCVIFMPAGNPAFKQDKEVSAAEDRFAMTLLATADNPHFTASRLEIDRVGITYTVDTLQALHDAYPDNVELFFITGADVVLSLLHWHDVERIAKLAHIVGATRPGYDLEEARHLLAEHNSPLDVTYIEVPALAISSSYLRERAGAGQSLRYLTPDSVIGYMHKHMLYGTTSGHYGQVAHV